MRRGSSVSLPFSTCPLTLPVISIYCFGASPGLIIGVGRTGNVYGLGSSVNGECPMLTLSSKGSCRGSLGIPQHWTSLVVPDSPHFNFSCISDTWSLHPSKCTGYVFCFPNDSFEAPFPGSTWQRAGSPPSSQLRMVTRREGK